MARVSDIVDFSKLTNNKRLYNVLENEFNGKYPQYFNKNPNIIIN